jgi:tetratricopeptide (TPR) repeat protein
VNRTRGTDLLLVLGLLTLLAALPALIAGLAPPEKLPRFLRHSWFYPTSRIVEEGNRALLRGAAGDAIRAAQLFEEALRRDPASPYRWASLADALLAGGQTVRARRCYAQAVALAPHSPAILFRAANFHFRLGELAPALAYTSRILSFTDGYDQVVFSAWDRLQVAPDLILRHGLPESPRPAESWLRYLIARGRLSAARMAWDWAVLRSYPVAGVAAGYLDLLLRNRQYEEASRSWVRFLGPRAGDYPASNSVYNPGFEAQPSDSPFDWRITPVEGVEVARDQTAAHSGSSSLLLRFAGRANLDYHHVSQRVVLPPGRYHFEAWIRTASITTDEGVAFRIFTLDNPKLLDAATRQLSGTNPWTRLNQLLSVPPPVRLVEIQLARRPSLKIDSRISGSVWIDSVLLRPLGPRPRRAHTGPQQIR